MSEQEDELLVLQSIYENDNYLLVARDGEDPGGMFMAPQKPCGDQPFLICLNSASDSSTASKGGKERQVLSVKYLPPITINFVFPWDYPSSQAPYFTLSCPWLSRQQLTRLCHQLDEIWEKSSGCSILYDWFQFLQEDAMNFLGIASPLILSSAIPHTTKVPSFSSSHTDSSGSWCEEEKGQSTLSDDSSVSPSKSGASDDSACSSQELCCGGLSSTDAASGCDERAMQDFKSLTQLLKILEEFDKEKEQEVFEQSIVECEVCFTEQLGRKCMRFVGCCHAFCRECLKSYFVVQINDGNVKAMTCPHVDCETQALPHQIKELVTLEQYERYDKLLLQTTLETMADVVYCPRKFCQHPVIKENNSNMGRCANCNFSFCTLCTLVYHGPSPCRIKSEELRKLREDYLKADEETKRFLEKRYGKRAINQALEETYSTEWLEKNAKMCPYCGTQIQKTEGCNKMTCIKCRSYFCWICHTLLSRSNPYSHFSTRGSPCFERLFEGVELEDEEWWDEDFDNGDEGFAVF